MESSVQNHKFEQGYRLKWFHHVHKAAGSSIVQMALKNGETFYPKHKNGNPVNSSNQTIDFSSMTRENLKDFVLNCFNKKVSFICTEFEFPDIEFLKNEFRNEIFFVTCLRNPYDRIVSNYFYDYIGNFYYVPPVIEEYYPGKYSYNRPNYYSVLFSGHREFNSETFDTAVKSLSFFNLIIVLELDSDFKVLRHFLGWKNSTNKPVNEKPSLFGLSIRFAHLYIINWILFVLGKQIRHINYTSILGFFLYLKYRLNKKTLSSFHDKFRNENQLDFLLYDRFYEDFRLRVLKEI